MYVLKDTYVLKDMHVREDKYGLARDHSKKLLVSIRALLQSMGMLMGDDKNSNWLVRNMTKKSSIEVHTT
jgi:hypothetical protein